MYIYGFTSFAGFDKVFKIADATLKPGDLIAFGEEKFLVLGDHVSFFEQYTKEYRATTTPVVLYKKLLSKQALDLLHWMTYYRYTNYKSVVKYFVNEDIETLLKHETKSQKKDIASRGQILTIFPDLRTLYNTIPESVLNDENVAVLSTQQSPKQKDIAWRKIKKGQVQTIFCTHGEMFQDYKNLKEIILVDPNKRYYTNQQDPRYKVKTVVKKMKTIYDAIIVLK